MTRDRIVIAGLTVLALGLRILGLDRRSVWFDEVITYFDAHVAWPDLLDSIRQDVHPPLAYMLYHLWPGVAAGDFWFRLPSAVLGALAVPMTWLWARRIVSREEALLTALFVAISPFLIDLAQEARMYGLLLLLTAVSLWLLDRVLTRPTWRNQLAYLSTAVAMLYTHYFGAFVLLAEGATALFAVSGAWTWRSRQSASLEELCCPGAWRALACLIIAGCLFVPWLPILAQQASSIRGDYWIESPRASTVLATFVAFAAHTPPDEQWQSPLRLAYAVLASLLAIGAMRVVMNARQRVALLLLVLPIGVALAASVMVAPIFAVRYVSPALLGFGLLVSRGIGELNARHRTLAVTAAVVALAPSVLALWPLYSDPGFGRADLRAAAHVVQSRRQPTDVILHLGAFSAASFDYYEVEHPSLLLMTNERSELCQTIRGHSSAWLVTAYAPADDQVRAEADAGIADPRYAGSLVREPPLHFPGVSIFHLVGEC